tara:strand:- start:1261 stop:2715 length:1455 start_codon:yes stop_codon:yes gene_type:complete
MFEAVFQNIDNIMRTDAGCSTVIDYVEQTSWILFLKYLDDYEKGQATAALLTGESYKPILDTEFQWSNWAAPKLPTGGIDYNSALTGPDLINFVDKELFPYFRQFRLSADNARTLEYKIGEIFDEINNKLQSGYALRNVIDAVDGLSFLSNDEKYELSSLYEDKIKNMGNAGQNSGEYYTPRPLIKSIVEVIDPQIGETIYDPAVGSAGFLCAAYDHIRTSKELTATEYDQLQNHTLYGKEKKSLAYVIGLMNMILHGVEAPNLVHTNTLNEIIVDIQERDKVDVVLANPPFGGSELQQIQQNFPIPSSETAYMFLQHFIRVLKDGGRGGIVIKNTFLSNTDNASTALRKQLLEECNLYAVLDLPGGTFTGAGVKTVVLLFGKGKPTEKIWYYQLNLNRNLGKTNPLNEKDLAEFRELAPKQELCENSWIVDIADINTDTWDLTVNNPNRVEIVDSRTPAEIIAEIKQLDVQAAQALQAIEELL